MALDQNSAAPSSEGREADLSPPPASKVDKGKGKAKEVEPEEEEEGEEEEEDDDDEDDDDDDDDLDQDLEDLINDVDPSDIVPVTRQRSARSKPIDYSSTEAMQKAGLEGDNAAAAAYGARPSEEDEDDTDFKGDETMEDDF